VSSWSEGCTCPYCGGRWLTWTRYGAAWCRDCHGFSRTEDAVETWRREREEEDER